MRGEAALAVDLYKALYEEPIARVERGVVVAAEQTERHEADRRVEILGEYPFWHAREALLGAREGDEHVREHGGGAACAKRAGGTQDVESCLLSLAHGKVAGVQTQQELWKLAGEEAGGLVDAAGRRI